MEDVQALRFTTRVLNESMRLYPQPPVLIRRALADDVLYGYKVRASAAPMSVAAAMCSGFKGVYAQIGASAGVDMCLLRIAVHQARWQAMQLHRRLSAAVNVVLQQN